MEIVATLIIGILAGWLGSKIFEGGNLGLPGNLIVGILGGFAGYWCLDKLGASLGGGWIGAALTGALGAIFILGVLNIALGSKS